MSITTTYVDGQVLKAENVTEIVTKINANETSINGLGTNKVDKVSGKSLVADTEIVKIHEHTNKTVLNNTTAPYTTTEQTKLGGISTGANVNNISDVNATELTDTTDTSLHYHSSDRNRSNHTGTQSASTIIQDANNRFVTDAEKTTWNGKAIQTDIDNSINNIQIGGRNLLTGSDFENGLCNFGGYATSVLTWSTDYAYRGVYSLKTVCGSGGNGVTKLVNDLFPYIKGKTVTLSWKVKGIGSSIGKRVLANIWDNVLDSRSGAGVTLTTDWQTISVTCSISNTASSLQVYWLGIGSLVAGDIVYSDCAKLEIGTKVTDWTPAPEDIDNSIALKADKTTNGTTATRPTATYIGQSHFDTTLGKPIWWNGTVWKDAMGTTV